MQVTSPLVLQQSPLLLQCDEEEENNAVISNAICSSRKRYWELRRQYAPHVLEVVDAISQGKFEEKELPINHLIVTEGSFKQMHEQNMMEDVRSTTDGDPLTAEEGTDWHNWHDNMKIAQVPPLEELGLWTGTVVDTLDCGIFRCVCLATNLLLLLPLHEHDMNMT